MAEGFQFMALRGAIGGSEWPYWRFQIVKYSTDPLPERFHDRIFLNVYSCGNRRYYVWDYPKET